MKRKEMFFKTQYEAIFSLLSPTFFLSYSTRCFGTRERKERKERKKEKSDGIFIKQLTSAVNYAHLVFSHIVGGGRGERICKKSGWM